MFGIDTLSIESWGLALSVLGFAAGLAQLFFPPPKLATRLIHIFYVLVLAGITLLFVSIINSNRGEIQTFQLNIEARDSIGKQATAVYEIIRYESSSNCQAVILAAFTFIEKFKADLPESFEIAKEIASGLTEPKSNYYEQPSSCRDKAEAMVLALKALAVR